MKKVKAMAIVPARGGSKRLPRKNALPLNDKPLISYTLEAATKSQCFERVLFSSDDEELLEIAAVYDVDCEKRSAELASDTSRVIELVNFLVEKEELRKQFDVIALLLPTCPFRRSTDIQKGFSLLTDDVDSVVSMTSFDFPPQLSMKLGADGLLKPVFEPCALMTGDTRSQDQAEILHPNGGFYISWWEKLLVNKNFFNGRVRPCKMSRLYSADVDTLDDFKHAEYLIKSGAIAL